MGRFVIKRKIRVPSAPVLSAALTVSETALDVVLATASTGSYPIAQYVLERSTNQSTWTQIAAGLGIFGSAMKYPDTGLTAGVTYYYRCRAVDSTGRTSQYGYTSGQPSPPPNYPPVWSTGWTLSIQQGGSQSVAQYASDPNGDSLTFARNGGNAPAGVTVTQTGTVEVASGVTASSYTVGIDASDGVYTTNTVVAIAVTDDGTSDAVPTSIIMLQGWENRAVGADPEISNFIRADYHRTIGYTVGEVSNTTRGTRVASDYSADELPLFESSPVYSGSRSCRYRISGPGDSRSEHTYADSSDLTSAGWGNGRKHWLGFAARLSPTWPLSSYNSCSIMQAPHLRSADIARLGADASPLWTIRLFESGTRWRINGYKIAGGVRTAWSQEFNGALDDLGVAMSDYTNDRGNWVRFVVEGFYHPTDGVLRFYMARRNEALRLVCEPTAPGGALASGETYPAGLFTDNYPASNGFGVYHSGMYASTWDDVGYTGTATNVYFHMDAIRILDETGNLYTADPMNGVTP